ncbi:FecR family protein [Pedobacter metabolipauper]|uniref:FecR family protein n=1 Tax=Pedobacter metabolipauper TaxID=425513 RepID=A0A4V3D0S0_9SPHI|nr:FecR domain-containing protein [Pedobacter metabolipauper]TDQ07108.1 FecR family protein [Pedobacter metabolipauper]
MPSNHKLEKEQFLKILSKYRAGTATPEEKQFLDAYNNSFDARENVLENMNADDKEKLKSSIRNQIMADVKKDQENDSLKSRSYLAKPINIKSNGKGFGNTPVFNSISLIRLISAAACLVVVSFAAYLFINKGAVNSALDNASARNSLPITPGVNKAIFTMANGSKVVLDDEKDEQLIYQMMDSVNEPTEAYNSVVTPRGTQYKLTLPDGTKVWLNSASSIRFPSSFTGAQRRVEMTGEVYFEVAKKAQPFIVQTEIQQVEVLGTHFNINAYSDEAEIKTTLLEGSVKVSGPDQKANILKPGQQSAITLSGYFKGITEVDVEMVVAWKNGYFKFNRQDLKTVMRQISRWYDVEVEYSGTIPEDEYVGKIKRSEDVSDVLNVLRLSKLNFTVEGRKIIVKN